MIAAALGAAQDSETGSERAVAAGIGGAVDAHNRALERAGQVERASVSSDDQRDAAGKGDELFQ